MSQEAQSSPMSIRRTPRLATLLAVVAGVAAQFVPLSTVDACEAIAPRLATVVNRADYIVVATVAASPEPTQRSMVLDVIRTLKGDVPSVLRLDGIVTSVCGDGADDSAGETLIFAHHFLYDHQRLDAFWYFDRNGALLDTNVMRFKTDPPATLASVQAAILSQLPDTATAPPLPSRPNETSSALLGIVFAAVLGAFAWHRRRRIVGPLMPDVEIE